MTFIELAKKRCSVRSFTKDPVDPALLSVILEAGTRCADRCEFAESAHSDH
jgi:nitroreductase